LFFRLSRGVARSILVSRRVDEKAVPSRDCQGKLYLVSFCGLYCAFENVLYLEVLTVEPLHAPDCTEREGKAIATGTPAMRLAGKRSGG
jgi:hypothetical protein